jgi:DNA-binding LytR/AlgR family response regulator
MEVEIKLDPNCKQPKVIIYTNEITQEINDLAKSLSGVEYSSLAGYKSGEILLIRPDDIIRIYSQGQKVLAQLEKDTVQLKYRLYELENRLAGTSFMRISNSEIVNFKKVVSLDMNMSGTISLKYKSGEKSFVSRRYIEKIKRYLEI